jgi:hypothetical protein
VVFGFNDHVDELAVVQALRADPPGRASKNRARRRVFGAALQQFDELLTAAGAVGPPSAPLPLFYALSQAGRAIAAAHCPDNRWEYTGHGLDVTVGSMKIGRTQIKPAPAKDGGDAFTVVADATDSDTLAGPVELGELWASIPNMPVVEGLGEEFPKPIYLSARARAFDTYVTGEVDAVIESDVGALPEADREAALAEQLAAYPAAEWFRIAPGVMTGPRQIGVMFLANAGDAIGRPLGEVGEAYLDDLSLYLRPGLGPDGRVPSVLMTWWAVLLELSQLARYVPAAWTAALDRDSSPLAVPIETGLRTARRIMPRLVLHALTGRWT